ncbi:sulfotransferase domain-containing protein [Flavobacteriales bacterium]|jgi:hypothetical protein|nr:sulfotransferase domain-containing protein [Flavobacteriales bacterium]
MIISHRHKYLFVGLPLAASTAISKELCEMYDGVPILSKHSLYQDFLKVAKDDEKKYKVIACSRNPLDISVSYYTKMVTDSNGNFSNESLLRKNGGHLKMRDYKLSKFFRDNQSDYNTFLEMYYQFPFDNWLSITAPHCDFIIRFEHLIEDFEQALIHCGIAPKRSLPLVNKTDKKKSFDLFYNESNKKIGLAIFGPFMQKHNMPFPAAWGECKVSWLTKLQFNVLSLLRTFYWMNKSYRNTNAQKVYKELLEKHQ